MTARIRYGSTAARWGLPALIAAALEDVVNEIVVIDEDIARRIAQIQRELGYATERLASGVALNECGVIQSSGVELDRLCAQRAVKVRELVRLAFVAFDGSTNRKDEFVKSIFDPKAVSA